MQSWIESANANTEFPLQNLPYGVFRAADGRARCGTAIGDSVVDLAALEEGGLLEAGGGRPVFADNALNGFMALGPASWDRVRARLVELLAEGGAADLRDDPTLRARCLHSAAEVALQMPARIRGYTDFNGARQHAFNAGAMLRGATDALPPNWLHLPVAYNGRASTVVVSGTPIRRPCGQYRPEEAAEPVFGPTQRLDFELELGALIGTPTMMGESVDVAAAERLIFGYVLLNDWSARDIQRWETPPLGPVQGKAFGTTISPWVVTHASLETVRVPAPPRDRALLSYLTEPHPMNLDIALEAAIRPAGTDRPHVVTRTNARHLYYSVPQMISQHTACGCLLETGDLIGTGTVSGPDETAWASLLELSRGGSLPVPIGDTARTWLGDGDEVRLSGGAIIDGTPLGFGPCDGTLLPAQLPAT